MNKVNFSLRQTAYFLDLVRDAADFYALRQGIDLADRFLDVVGLGLEKIKDNPYIGPRYIPPEEFAALIGTNYRKLALSNFSPFPYTLYYEILSKDIVIHALHHHSRHRDRLLSGEHEE